MSTFWDVMMKIHNFQESFPYKLENLNLLTTTAQHQYHLLVQQNLLEEGVTQEDTGPGVIILDLHKIVN